MDITGEFLMEAFAQLVQADAPLVIQQVSAPLVSPTFISSPIIASTVLLTAIIALTAQPVLLVLLES